MDTLRGSGEVAPRRVRRERRPELAVRALDRPRRTIVHLSAEYYPYARTGGLAEAVAGLATCQARAGERVVVFVPLYSSVREVVPDLQPLGPSQLLELGPRAEEVRFFRAPTAPGAPEVIFVDAPTCFQRPGLYGERGADYPDNHRRFALFSRAALEGTMRVAGGPALLHVHDWHPALAPVYLRTHAALAEQFGPTPVVVSVHNAGYQGHFPESAMDELGLPRELWTPDRLEWYGRLNMLKGALTCCDMAVTVSPTHAAELRTPEGGFGLHDTFVALGNRLLGICNGIDQKAWNPATDPEIVANYSASDLAGKRACKSALQRSFGLPERTDVPLFGMTARLVEQKGLDIVLRSERVRALDAQFIFLGKGEPWYQEALAARAAERPYHVAVEFAFTDALEHRLTGGSDLVLMPSLYEPCGLTQMRALRYGAPAVARNVGGIHDTVEDDVTGFLFDPFDERALDAAIDRALDRFAQRRSWTAMMRRGMARDFGWERSAAAYREVYAAAERVVAAAAA